MMEHLAWGLQATVVGMGLVFGLLALLWGVLELVLRFDRSALEPVTPEAAIDAAEQIAAAVDDKVGAQIPVIPTVHGMDADLVAAIMIATLTHKAICRREAAAVMRSFWPGSLLHVSRWVSNGRVLQNRAWLREGK
jgi:Na+-transporting methylmalonyl-CoA/oxaloacetate decarboxylase gamma subunit